MESSLSHCGTGPLPLLSHVSHLLSLDCFGFYFQLFPNFNLLFLIDCASSEKVCVLAYFPCVSLPGFLAVSFEEAEIFPWVPTSSLQLAKASFALSLESNERQALTYFVLFNSKQIWMKRFFTTLRYSNKNVTVEIMGSIALVQVNILLVSLENVISVWGNRIFPHPLHHFLYFLQRAKSKILLCLCILAFIRCRYIPRVKIKSQG